MANDAPERWVWCDLGHRHWGALGGAGLFISKGKLVLLGQRSAYTDYEFRYGIPSGARRADESAEDTAVRETLEETDLSVHNFSEPVRTAVVDHGGWTFTTVFVEAKDGCPGYVRPQDNETLHFHWRSLSSVGVEKLMPSLITVLRDQEAAQNKASATRPRSSRGRGTPRRSR